MLYASLRLYHTSTQCASMASDDDSFRLVVESACLLGCGTKFFLLVRTCHVK